MQVNKLTVLLSAVSQYRQPYQPQSEHESHIIICGSVGDWKRLERLFRQFFNPDRDIQSIPDLTLLIMSTVEPSEDLKTVLNSPQYDGRISYLVGSSLSGEDLFRARADTASAMIFLCNMEAKADGAKLDDAATLLRTLSVSYSFLFNGTLLWLWLWQLLILYAPGEQLQSCTLVFRPSIATGRSRNAQAQVQYCALQLLEILSCHMTDVTNVS